MNKRDSIEIERQILGIAREGCRKSRIVYQANLNFRIVKGYISRLQNRGLLEIDNKIFKTTEKGEEFVKDFDALIENFK